jgi:hypothetical protein
MIVHILPLCSLFLLYLQYSSPIHFKGHIIAEETLRPPPDSTLKHSCPLIINVRIQVCRENDLTISIKLLQHVLASTNPSITRRPKDLTAALYPYSTSGVCLMSLISNDTYVHSSRPPTQPPYQENRARSFLGELGKLVYCRSFLKTS